jgi:hypothetical protein
MNAMAYMSECGGAKELEGEDITDIRKKAIAWQRSVNFCQGKAYTMIIDYGTKGKERIGWRH